MRVLTALLLLSLLAGCSGSPPAPVEDRSARPDAAQLEADGRYRVRRGDTLFGIAFSYGLDFRDIARWNGISSPYVIYPDQKLRLTPPPRTTATQRPATPRPAAPTSTTAAPPVAKTAPPAGTSGPGDTSTRQPGRTSKPADVSGAAPFAWQWPVKGRVLRTFAAGDASRKGVDIDGRVGQSVQAAAPGTVVYSGSGLIGYGELIIVKHSDNLLSAYAHNQVRLVREGAQVKGGQKIAEMGRNDRNEALLHFEIRVNGKPADPLKYLPAQ